MEWFIVIIVAFITIIIVNQVVLHVMTKRSQKVKNLININKNTVFKNLQEVYNVRHMCNSKRQLERFNLDEYILALIGVEDSYYFKVISNALYNEKEYKEYINQYEFILSSPCNDVNTKKRGGIVGIPVV